MFANMCRIRFCWHMHAYTPTNDETVVKKVCLDVLHPDGFIEAVGNQKT